MLPKLSLGASLLERLQTWKVSNAISSSRAFLQLPSRLSTATQQDAPFLRLPDEILLAILRKIEDKKCIRRLAETCTQLRAKVLGEHGVLESVPVSYTHLETWARYAHDFRPVKVLFKIAITECIDMARTFQPRIVPGQDTLELAVTLYQAGSFDGQEARDKCSLAARQLCLALSRINVKPTSLHVESGLSDVETAFILLGCGLASFVEIDTFIFCIGKHKNCRNESDMSEKLKRFISEVLQSQTHLQTITIWSRALENHRPFYEVVKNSLKPSDVDIRMHYANDIAWIEDAISHNIFTRRGHDWPLFRYGGRVSVPY